MHKSIFLFWILTICYSNSVTAQKEYDPALPIYKIAVFAPLHLDAVFKDDTYQYPKKFPRYVLPGLAFVQGMEIASDSFPVADYIIETLVFDTKSDTLTIQQIISRQLLDDCKLIVVSGKEKEINDLAGFAKSKSIPLISATYPNEAGIRNNPFYVIMNATLKTHCERIFSYLLQKHSDDKILMVTQSGNQEERVLNNFKNINQSDEQQLLPIKTIILDSNYYKIKNELDSNSNNIIICGSLDENFAEKICKAIVPLQEKYNVKIIGMPNTSTYNFLNKSKSASMKGLPIYYTSPNTTTKNNIFTESLRNAYIDRYKGYPSESAYKGFEIMYIFSRLVGLFPGGIINHLNDNLFSTFNEFQFIPVTDLQGQIDYIENKHLYFIKRMNGVDVKSE